MWFVVSINVSEVLLLERESRHTLWSFLILFAVVWGEAAGGGKWGPAVSEASCHGGLSCKPQKRYSVAWFVFSCPFFIYGIVGIVCCIGFIALLSWLLSCAAWNYLFTTWCPCLLLVKTKGWFILLRWAIVNIKAPSNAESEHINYRCVRCIAPHSGLPCCILCSASWFDFVYRATQRLCGGGSHPRRGWKCLLIMEKYNLAFSLINCSLHTTGTMISTLFCGHM